MGITSESERFRHLRATEETIADQLHTSATRSEIARTLLGIPEDVSGLTIVDLASGASPLVTSLLADSADAYGVDRLYRNKKRLQKEIEGVLPRVLRNIPRDKRREIETQLRRSISSFTQSLTQQPGRYRGDWLTQLSFPDAFSDLTVSLNGLSDLAAHIDVFSQAWSEAMRITKPGGTIMMAPFHTPTALHSKYADAHNRLYATLAMNPRVSVTVFPATDYYWDAKLKVIKL